ncbi:MAG: alginate lyase family protein, partial [Candidatus Omnitrophica bacterium]|nr:alginate lyase family protein [Candidatus Omnitrophota bacterium]
MKKFIWYIRSLSCMSVQEVAYRACKLVQLNIYMFINRKVELEKVLNNDKNGARFYFDANRSLEIGLEFSKLFPDRIGDIIADSENICNHKFKIFDSEWNLGEEIDWHRNRHNLKDARFIWELNRHQHLVTLGKAYFLTGQKRYAIETRDQVLSWISQNPAYKGVNWKSSLEVSLRLISWCWTYKLIKSSGVFSISSNRRFLEYIYRHAEFTRNNLSRYSSDNNHSIGEAAGLLIAGFTFPGFKAAGKWLDTGKKVLFKEILDQVHPDGVTKEQALGYQGFVMELALLAIVLLQKNDIEMPKGSLERFYSMAEFIKNIMDTNGNVPHIGDSDNGAAIRLSSARDYSMYRSLLSSASILSDRGDFKEKG